MIWLLYINNNYSGTVATDFDRVMSAMEAKIVDDGLEINIVPGLHIRLVSQAQIEKDERGLEWDRTMGFPPRKRNK